jgi:hypothetical protein
VTDARFEDAGDRPLNLGALDADDLAVISALVQDAVFSAKDMSWDAKGRRFSLLIGRFRWEDRARIERVRSMLQFSGVDHVASTGFDRKDGDTPLSILALSFHETDIPSGDMVLTLAGGGAIKLRVEALDVTLKDVTKPYAAPSKRAPSHPE